MTPNDRETPLRPLFRFCYTSRASHGASLFVSCFVRLFQFVWIGLLDMMSCSPVRLYVASTLCADYPVAPAHLMGKAKPCILAGSLGAP